MARRMNRFSGSSDDSDINLTPMLDVVFIMLIFFIVTATFIKQAGIDVLRPDAFTDSAKPLVSVLVAIGPNGDIWIDKNKVDPETVRAHIERLHAENPKGGKINSIPERFGRFSGFRGIAGIRTDNPCLVELDHQIPSQSFS